MAPEKKEDKDEVKKEDVSSKALLGMMMGSENGNKSKVVDSETLVAQTQDRLW